MLPTLDIPFISSLHGRDRRSQRDISKRDLQAAVKYGMKEAGYPRKDGSLTWKYTYNNIVYITDATSTQEITSWANELPLFRTNIPAAFHQKYLEAKRRIQDNSYAITSHTVLVVDMSGSMAKADMNGYRTRARGVYYYLAEHFTADRLNPINTGLMGGKDVSYTDVVTLIEMRSNATIVFEYEPISWQLYNKFIELWDLSDTRDHGCYFSSIQTAFAMLERRRCSEKCALCLFFLSDGRPSDRNLKRKRPSDIYMEKGRCYLLPNETSIFPNNIIQLVRSKCTIYKDRLTFSAICFGKDSSDFDIMKNKIEVAKELGCKSYFNHFHWDVDPLRTMLSTTMTSLTQTRTLLSRLNGFDIDKNREWQQVEKDFILNDQTFILADYQIYNDAQGYLVSRNRLEYEKACEEKYTACWNEIPFHHPDATGVAVHRKAFGEGAERIVFKMTEINDAREPVGMELVAKASLYKHQVSGLVYLQRWYKTFVKTQMKAFTLARKFNAKLDQLGISRMAVPRVHFLECAVYEVTKKRSAGIYGLRNACTAEDNELAYLAEARLDPSRYVKWNNNNGGVDGIVREHMHLHETLQACLLPKKLGAIEEGNDSEEDEDENDDDAALPGTVLGCSPEVAALLERVLEQDVPQAFSHFTYIYTQRDMLVCDLQGELKIVGGFPTFELTDPCIHCVNRRRFGRTDHGMNGVNTFFQTHHCNSVCKVLSIADGSYTG